MGSNPSATKPSSKEKWILISIVLGTFMASLDATIVAVALPTIRETLHLGSLSSDVSWILMGYTLSLCCFILLWGKLGTNFGYKKLFLLGVTIFASLSLIIGITGTMGIGGNGDTTLFILIGLRIIQGIGAGMIMSMGLAMVSSYLPSIRGRAVGMITLASSVGTACGPVIGGLLCQFDWSYIFFINVPIGIICIVMSSKSMANVTEVRGSKEKLDGVGVLLMVIMMFTLIYYLNTANNNGWFSNESIALLAVAFISCGILIWWEGRVKDPLISLRILKIKDVVGSNMVSLLAFGAVAGSYLLLPYYLEYVKGFSTVDMGLILVANSVGMMAVGPAVGRISDKTGINNKMLSIGCLVSALGFFMMMHFNESTPLIYILLTLFVMGAGAGTAMVASTNLSLSYSQSNEEGLMSSIINTFRQAGSSVGVAILESIFAAGIIYPMVLPGSIVDAFKPAFFIAAVLCLFAFVLSTFLKDKKVREGSADNQ